MLMPEDVATFFGCGWLVLEAVVWSITRQCKSKAN